MDRTVDAVPPVAMEEEAVDVAAAEVEDGTQDHGGQSVETRWAPGPPAPEPRQDRLRRQQGAESGGVERSRIAKQGAQHAHRGAQESGHAGAERQPAAGGIQQLQVDRAPGHHRHEAGEQEEQRRAGRGQAQPAADDLAEAEDRHRSGDQDQELERHRNRVPSRLHQAEDGYAGDRGARQQQPADAGDGAQASVFRLG